MHKIFERETNHGIVYPLEIIQTSMGRGCREKSFHWMEHNDCFHVASGSQQRVREPQTDNISSLQNCFQRNSQSVIPVYFKQIGKTLGQFF